LRPATVLLTTLSLAASPARADRFECPRESTPSRADLGEIDGGEVTWWACDEAASGGEYFGESRLIWTDEREGTRVRKVTGWGMSAADSIEARREGDRFVLEIPRWDRAAWEGERQVEIWRWDAKKRDFVLEKSAITSAYGEHLDRMKAYLKKGDFMLANGLLARVGTSPNGGFEYLDEEVYLYFLEAYLVRGRGLNARNKKDEAALAVGQALRWPPTNSAHRDDKPPRGTVVIEHLDNHRPGAPHFVALAPDPAAVKALGEAARILIEGGARDDISLAVGLLDQLVRLDRARPEDRLQLADGLWAMEQKRAARDQYQAFYDLARDAEPPLKIPERVDDRR